MRLHLTPEGPRPCQVDPGNPSSRGYKYSEHFSDLAAAEKVFENSLEKTYGSSSTLTPPLAEALVLEKLEKLLPKDTVGFTVVGSRL